MRYSAAVKNLFHLSLGMVKYNLKIIFADRFIWFLLAALAFFLFFAVQVVLDRNTMSEEIVYSLLIFPGILLIFYPSVFGIQSDADQRTLEIIFGIPDYRYKVWLFRYAMILILVFLLMIPFSALAHWALISFPFFHMILQLMVLVFFVSSMGFSISTIVKNGNATAVIMVIIGLVFLIMYDAIEYSKWNVFLNPFNTPYELNDIVWQETIRQNRIIMGIISVIMLLLGLLNLQQREKFLR